MTKATLRGRLALGWEAEDAITRGKGEEPPLRFTHFGRTLTLRGWAEQSGITFQSLYTRVFSDDITRFKDALLQGPDEPGYTTPLTAFGQTKPLHLWALDPRAACAAHVLRQRVQANWPPEKAITQKYQPRKTDPAGIQRQADPGLTTEHIISAITPDQMRPGDTVLHTGQDPDTGLPTLSVRRPAPSATEEDRRAPAQPSTPSNSPAPGPPPGTPLPPTASRRR